jgi:hypothetical protein
MFGVPEVEITIGKRRRHTAPKRQPKKPRTVSEETQRHVDQILGGDPGDRVGREGNG